MTSRPGSNGKVRRTVQTFSLPVGVVAFLVWVVQDIRDGHTRESDQQPRIEALVQQNTNHSQRIGALESNSAATTQRLASQETHLISLDARERVNRDAMMAILIDLKQGVGRMEGELDSMKSSP